jgi:hypothetical protein
MRSYLATVVFFHRLFIISIESSQLLLCLLPQPSVFLGEAMAKRLDPKSYFLPGMLIFGSAFGSEGQINKVHCVVLRMSPDLQQFGFLTRATLSMIEGMDSTCDENVIHALLRELIYVSGGATNFAALRVRGMLKNWTWLHENVSNSSAIPPPGQLLPDITGSQDSLYFAPSVIFRLCLTRGPNSPV